VPCATGLLGSSLRNSPVIKQGYRPVLKFRSIGPGVRKSGFANGSPKGILRSFAIGNDGWAVITFGIINTSTGVLNLDVHYESFSIDLVAVVLIAPIPNILSGGDVFLRDSRTAILLEIRFTFDPESTRVVR